MHLIARAGQIGSACFARIPSEFRNIGVL